MNGLYTVSSIFYFSSFTRERTLQWISIIVDKNKAEEKSEGDTNVLCNKV